MAPLSEFRVYPIPSVQSPSLPETSPRCLPFQRPEKFHNPSTQHARLTFVYGPVNSGAYSSALDSCYCPDYGKQIHAHSLKNGLHGHKFVETKLLQMYGKCGQLRDATLLFEKMPVKNVYSWTAVLGVYVETRFYKEAFLLLQEMLYEDFELEFFVFPVALKICSGFGGVELGKQLHGIVTKKGYASNIYVGNALIDMYGKCACLDDAKKCLHMMPEKDCVSWNSIVTACAANGMVYEALDFLEIMSLEGGSRPNRVSWSALIGGFSQNGHDEEAIRMLFRMQAAGFEPNARTLASVLPSCSRLQNLSLGKEIHGYVTRHNFVSNPFVVNGLVDVYRRCADMENAFKIFSKFSLKNDVSFNTIIVGYCENGKTSKAKELFDQMKPAGVSTDIISWNSMISGYVDNSMYSEALNMFRDLLKQEDIRADSFTFGSVLCACADMRFLRLGKQAHAHSIVRGLQSNPFVGGALVEMYCKCNELEAAQAAFNEVIERDTATWNALISGYTRCNQVEHIHGIIQKMMDDGFEANVYTWNGIIAGHVENGHHEAALRLFVEMQDSSVKPDIYAVGIVLSACTKLATIGRGKQVHAYSIRCCYDLDAHIGAALVDMYAKCGSIKLAHLAYSRITKYNLVTQNAILTAYAMHGYGEEGISFFREMIVCGIRPDEVTFLSVLSSCAHAGAVETGRYFFNLMEHFNVNPTLKHYTCMVDLLSRTGLLNEAYDVVTKMPMEPDSVIWAALLSGCVVHSNINLGELSAQKLIELEPDNTGNHIMLANLYASAGKWVELGRTRRIIRDRQMLKSPGCSWIEDRDSVNVFVASDRSHKRAGEIYGTLDNLSLHIMEEDLP